MDVEHILRDEAPGDAVTAVERVVRSLTSGIQYGRYVPGQRLVESELTARLGVSRGTVREALRRLEAEGLVQLEKNRGASVRRMSKQDVAELNEIRAVLEGHAAAAAARSATDADRTRLTALESFWESDDASAPEQYLKYNAAFHDLILEMSKSRRLPGFIQQTSLSVFRTQFHLQLIAPRRIAMSRTEHARIVDAILSRDAPAAEAAMRAHVATSSDVILSAPAEFFA